MVVTISSSSSSSPPSSSSSNNANKNKNKFTFNNNRKKKKLLFKFTAIQTLLILVVPFLGLEIYILYYHVIIPNNTVTIEEFSSPSSSSMSSSLSSSTTSISDISDSHHIQHQLQQHWKATTTSTSSKTKTQAQQQSTTSNLNNQNNLNNNSNSIKYDGLFNGHPIIYQELKSSKSSSQQQQQQQQQDDTESSFTELYSQMHCIGEGYTPPRFHRRDSTYWDMGFQSRSCHFEFICYDMERKDFVIFLNSNTTRELEKVHPIIDSTQTVFTNQSLHHKHIKTQEYHDYKFGVSIGGINQKWTIQGIDRLQWFPRIIWDNLPDSVYTLPSKTIMLPFHSLSAANPGHLVWDDFLPIFTILDIFQFAGGYYHDGGDFKEEKGNSNNNTTTTNTTTIDDESDDDEDYDVLMIRYQLPGEGFWAGCDWRPERTMDCEKMLEKFAPLMTSNPQSWKVKTQHTSTLQLTAEGSKQNKKSNYICSRHGLAGLGSLTDHGIDKGHGWERRDYERTHNAWGRGGQFWKFRNFMMSNLGLPIVEEPTPPLDHPDNQGKPLIVVSERSSKLGNRNFDFGRHIQAIKDLLGEDSILIQQYSMKKLSLKKQAEIVSRASFYITGCGGGAVTATFLPKGASLIIFYHERGGVENNKQVPFPARLDWDYFNNIAYNRVHWMPAGQRHLSIDKEALALLVQHDLELMKQERSDWMEQQQKQKQQQPPQPPVGKQPKT